MKNALREGGIFVGLVLGCLGAGGCDEGATSLFPTPPPKVTISQPIARTVIDYGELRGRIDAVETVEVRARVSGYLDKVHFEAGQLVQRGDLLFQIDDRTYRAELDQAQAAVERSEAMVVRADADVRRAEKLMGSKSIAQEEYDRIVANRLESKATLRANAAAVVQAQLNLDFTRITAPIAGRISRPLISEGNLVNDAVGWATLLTTIVSIDPVYAYFDVDESTMLRYRDTIKEGKAKNAGQGEKPPLELRLANESGFPHKGHVDFVENRLDPTTGTIRMRGVFPNPDDALTPGLFVVARLPWSKPHPALLVSEGAILTKQGQKYVWVVVEEDGVYKVERRDVQLGALVDGLRAIDAGLTDNDWVVVNGLQRVRLGGTVDPVKAAMPLPAKAEGRAAAASKKKPTGEKGAGGAGDTDAEAGPAESADSEAQEEDAPEGDSSEEQPATDELPEDSPENDESDATTDDDNPPADRPGEE